MMEDNLKIKVKGLHSVWMQDDELRGFLGDTHLTLRRLIKLYLIRSPYIQGGELDIDKIIEAKEILELEENHDLMVLHEKIQNEISTAMRVYEILVPDESQKPHKTSEIRVFSPEWVADTITMAAKALPSLTFDEAFDMPLVALLHLGMAAMRANGQITERPHGIMEALKKLQEMKENGGHQA